MLDEGLSGGLGLFLVFGIFAVTLFAGVYLFISFLKSQKALSKPTDEVSAAEGEKLARRLSDKPALKIVRPKAEPEAELAEKPVAESVVAETKLPDALSKTRASLFGRIQNLFGGRQTLSESEREELEEVLYTADLGPRTVQDLLDHVFTKLKSTGETGFEAVRRELHHKMSEILTAREAEIRALEQKAPEFSEVGLNRLAIFEAKPAVLMVVGVNGAGKTTTIGKLSAKLAGKGMRVLVAAGDTFRAAAGEQLKTWTDRAAVGGTVGGTVGGGVEIFDPENVTEPSAVAYQALELAKAKGFDVVIVDTAGRLHTQKNLMEELKKMKRVLGKIDPTAPHETLLVLDANSGQNALIQAKEFHGALSVDGVVLTKLDGSAKGGVAVGISNEVGLPIKLIGVGEKIGDLRSFEPRDFVDSILPEA